MDPELSEEALEARLVEVRQDHADMDTVIQALSHSPVTDMMLIARLKRKKLALKDEMARLEDMLTPDIIA